MKIIDLLNKIAKGEEVPKKIDYNCLGGYFALDMSLDHEIKVVEEVEDKEYEDIEEIPEHILNSVNRMTNNIAPQVLYNCNKINALIRNQKYILGVLNDKDKNN